VEVTELLLLFIALDEKQQQARLKAVTVQIFTWTL